MAFDVLIVGGGPAGLAASIQLKQLAGDDLSVCLIDKGSEIGAHILSGNVLDPKALHELFPEKQQDTCWRDELLELQGSHATPVQQDEFLILPNATSSFALPNLLLPPQLHNDGNFIISLSQLCRYLATQAEELGVEIYPGFAASEVVYTDGAVKGIATRDVGIDKEGNHKATFEPGVELHARQTLFAEGARGSCSEALISKFNLRAPDHPQTYGLGLKEVWQIPDEQFKAGLVQHTLGWPLQDSILSKTFGGSFLYHQEPNLVLIGLVVGLDYANPYLNPYQEFQRWKTHPAIAKHLQGGQCVAYGARVLNEGGYHAIPNPLAVPGAALIGCSAGFLNAVKIKGTHTAMKSGMIAAKAAYEQLQGGESVASTGELPEDAQPVTLTNYQAALEESWIHEELYQVRNTHQAFSKWGVGAGLIYSGISCFVTKGKEPWTLSAPHTSDSDATSKEGVPIAYPPNDGVMTFDLLTNLQRSNTYHEEDQPAHLRIKPELAYVPESVSLQQFAGPEQRFCPAAVYEYPPPGDDSAERQLVINAQNCIHCKCCSIKMPQEYIEWTVPEGGGGPQYQIM